MNRRLVPCLLIALIAVSTIAPLVHASPPPPPPRPAIASVLRFTSSPALSTVDVVINDPNQVYGIQGALTLTVLQANGVPEVVPYGQVVVFPGNTTVRVYIHHAISAVQWVRVTTIAYIL